jgi:hypothetical protein
MKSCRHFLFPLVAGVVVSLFTSAIASTPNGQHPDAAVGAQRRPATVADLVSMVRPGDPLYEADFIGKNVADKIALFSPDQERFIVLLKKGNIDDNTNRYSILLWRTGEVFKNPKADEIFALSSGSNEPAIEGLRWVDNETIAFLGKQPAQPTEAFILNVRDRTLKKLTDHSTNLISFGIDPTARQVGFVAADPTIPLFTDLTNRHGLVVSDERLEELIAGQHAVGVTAHLFIQSNGGPAREVSIPVDAFSDHRPCVSPNGRYVVLLARPREIPNDWKEYKDPTIREESTRGIGSHEPTPLNQWMLVDMSTTKSRVLLNSPMCNSDCELIWLPNSDSVIITNTNLPLEGSAGPERELRRSSKFTVEVKIGTGQISKITNEFLGSITLEAASTGLVLRSHSKDPKFDDQEVMFKKIGDMWARSDARINKAAPQIVLKEDMNTPERIVAIDPPTSQEKVLFDLNPQFNNLIFGRVEEIHWKTPQGLLVKGGLYYPVHYVPAKRYPLVIQTHGWSSDRFLIDGPFPTAFAAQVLAGKDIMVLQAEETESQDGTNNTIEEAPGQEANYEGAVDYLDGKGLIDRERVGLVGFSRTCFHIKYTLTHSKYHFAAASVTDGIDGGYLMYLVRAMSSPFLADVFAKLNGGLPFGKGLESWLQHSSSFNLHKVQTPVLLVALQTQNLLGQWEWLPALHQLGKPVEMVAIRDGDHLLQKPWERLISLQGTVDWFSFWLKDDEDPDPAKAEQYARWRGLRKLQEQDDANTKAQSLN